MSKRHLLQERTDKPLAERYVSMSNALARSAQGLTLAEKRTVSLALAKTDSVSSKDAIKSQFANGWTVKLTAQEYAETYGVDSDTAYSQLKSATDNLLNRQVTTMVKTIKGIKGVKTNWCGQCTYHYGEGWVEIAFTHQISPYLLGLRSRFVSYKLRQASALRSIYSWRLLECLHSWGDKGKWSPNIEDFNTAMETPESCMGNFGMMRRRVIDPALKELREKDNMEIDLVLKKSGRKVTGLVFTFQSNPQGKLPI